MSHEVTPEVAPLTARENRLMETITGLNGRITELWDSREAVKKELAAVRQELSEFKTKCGDQSTKIGKLREECQFRMTENVDQQDEIKALKSAAKESAEENERLRDQIENLQTDARVSDQILLKSQMYDALHAALYDDNTAETMLHMQWGMDYLMREVYPE